MSQFPYPLVVIAACLLAACSSSNTPDNELQDDQSTPMAPVASAIENGRQFATTGRAAVLAAQVSTEITNVLNTLNEIVTSGTTNGNDLASNCLAGFDEGIGRPVAEFSCISDVRLSGTTATEFSGRVLVTDYCEAALATLQAQNCALQDGTIGLPLEWIAGETGTPAPLVAATITYRNADMTLTIVTPEQIGLPASNCAYDMANNGQSDEATVADCFARLVEVSDRLDTNSVNLAIPLQGVRI